MRRGRHLITALATLCFMATGCARLGLAEPSPARSSPDPATAVALSVLSDAVYLVDPSTGASQQVASGFQNFQAGYAAWSPGHRLLAFGEGGIVVLDPRTDERRVGAVGPSFSMPAWNGDGTQLAYGDGTALYVSVLGSTRPASLRLPATLAPFDMDWAPGSIIAFEGLQLDCEHGAGCTSTDRSDIWTIRPDGTGLHRLTRIGGARSPKWSPDHSSLLFIRRYPGSKVARSELWVVKADGTGVRLLTSATDVLAADWSPDGTRIALVREGSEPNTLQLWIVSADGSAARPVGDAVTGSASTVSW
ncbi:MAG: hypothetical protein E6G47_00940 [Actinobacteria bacterium]|nr:MAG: hypothetical protein E6G47_00940 [Actinomycetota bacterium]